MLIQRQYVLVGLGLLHPITRSSWPDRPIGENLPFSHILRSMPKLKTDAELLKHLEERAPEVLAAKVNFDALVGKVIAAGPVDTGRAPKRRKRKQRKQRTSKPSQN